ncbi:GGDEF domain-containing protein [Pseudoalteromonas mariniglutinosa]|uniref:GGDEF domain-containing protein n=1 Tax=Pseudoalteromonas mariniglutinosa TaxID=206042 RepID=UPI00384D746B
MFKFWYKEFPQYPKDHEDFWRTRLIAHALLLCSTFFAILTLLNIIYFNHYDIALLDFIGLSASLAIYVWFNKTADVNKTAWLVIAMICTIVISFIISVNGASYSLFWATLIPPLAFFLVGRNWGSIFTAITFTVCAYIAYLHSQQSLPTSISIGAVFNIVEVAIAHILIFRFYEKTRSCAYANLAKKNQEIKKIAETDTLTQLYNRDKFEQYLLATLKTQRPLAMIMLDIDFFKLINDTHGHLIGDKALVAVAERLQQQLNSNAFFARWGGEEFVIILPEQSLRQAVDIAESLRNCIASFPIQGEQLTISLGVTERQPSDSIYNLIERADKALYKAKQQGRNRVEVN